MTSDEHLYHLIIALRLNFTLLWLETYSHCLMSVLLRQQCDTRITDTEATDMVTHFQSEKIINNDFDQIFWKLHKLIENSINHLIHVLVHNKIL